MKKTCSKCGKELDITMFQRHPKSHDGYLNSCRNCSNLGKNGTNRKSPLTYMEICKRNKKQLKENGFIVKRDGTIKS